LEKLRPAPCTLPACASCRAQERKDFIEGTRRKIITLRDEVQGASMTPGFATAKSTPKLPSMGSQPKGYGKVTSQDDTIEMEPASEDILESGGSSSLHAQPQEPRARRTARKRQGRGTLGGGTRAQRTVRCGASSCRAA
jgi:hypothetical protein